MAVAEKMGKLRWYKRNPKKALNGMRDLTLEEIGAYNVVLDLIYLNDGKLRDDDRYVAYWCHCDLRVWRRVKVSLIRKNRLYIEAGFLRDELADVVVAEGLARALAAASGGREAARRRHHKLRVVVNNINGMADAGEGAGAYTPAMQNIQNIKTVSVDYATDTGKSSEEDKSSSSDFVLVAPPGAPTGKAKKLREKKVGSRLSPDWSPSLEDAKFAIGEGFTPEQARRETANFKDYWLAKSGANATKIDWSATYRMWMRRAKDGR